MSGPATRDALAEALFTGIREQGPSIDCGCLADALLASDFWAQLAADEALVEAMAPALEGSPTLALIALEALAVAMKG